MQSMFRKASIDRLSSPEELDQVIRISNSGSWAALVAIALLCGAATVWAVTGELPRTATGSGMIVRSGAVLTVVARGAGVVRSVDVTVGQRVEANQVVARIAQPALVEKLRGMREALAEFRVKRSHDLKLKARQIGLSIESVRRQHANAERAISVLDEQKKLTAARVPVMEQLLARGLVTNQQVLAERQKLADVESLIDQRRAEMKQFDAQAFELRAQFDALESEMRFEAGNRERDIVALANELELMATVTTPYGGEVVEIKVSPGGVVGTDGPMLTIEPQSDSLEAVVYVSAQQAKEIRVGMDARVSPSTVRREEYGFIRATVSFVAAYPATTAALMRNFQNDQLVTALTSDGPVTEVRTRLERDPRTPSGFRWSSALGPPVTVSAGTLSTAEIVTETRAPITLVIPLLRQRLGIG